MGRVNGKTGEVTMVKRESNPYGILVNSKGIPFFTLYETNKLGSINPDTMEIKEYVLPNPSIRPRRIAVTSDDVIWYGDYDRGYLGSYDPKTGKFKEWPSPSGPPSQIYGITVCERHRLVQRVGRQAEHHRALRPQDREVPELGHPVGRRRGAPHDARQGRQHLDSRQRCQQIGVVEVKKSVTRTSSLQ